MQKKEKKNGISKSGLAGLSLIENAKKEMSELSVEDANKLRQIEQNILTYKIQLADIEITVSDLNKRKESLILAIKHESDDFMVNVRKIAVKHGINPDGDINDDKWDLNTTTMVFHKKK